MDQVGQLADARAFFLLDGVDQERGPAGRSCRVGKLLDFLAGFGRVARNAEVHVKRVGAIAQLEQDIPQRQAVLAPGDCDQDAVLRGEHALGLDRARDLVMHKLVEAGLAERRVVAREPDHCLRLALLTTHLFAVVI